MRIISWNVNGIRAVHKKDLFLPFIKEYQPDVLCLQETKAKQEQSVIDLPQYIEYWNSAEKNGYSGTAIFSKTEPLNIFYDLPAEIAKKYDLEKDPYGDPNREGRVVTAEYENIFVVCVYTPNAKDDLSRIPLRHKKWDPAFLEYVLELEKQKPVVFCGDLNVAHTPEDLANPKQNEGKKGFTVEERQGIENYIHKGFVDTFRIFTKGNGHYSWFSYFSMARARNVGWRIDYVFVSSILKGKVKQAEILGEVEGSDHCPVMIDLKI